MTLDRPEEEENNNSPDDSSGTSDDDFIRNFEESVYAKEKEKEQEDNKKRDEVDQVGFGSLDRRNTDEDLTEEENNPKKSGRGVIATLIAVITLSIVGLLLWFFDPFNWFSDESNDEEIVEEDEINVEDINVSVPATVVFNYGNPFDEEEACLPFEESGLECIAEEEVAEDEEIVRGEIISQSYNEDETVEEGDTIELVYSSGPEEAVMPDVNNTELDEISEALYYAGIDVEDTEYTSGSGLAEDRVISASIDEGEAVSNGDSVTLYLSDGTINVPEWEGEIRETVENEASDLNITVEFETEESDEISGTVLSQSETGAVDRENTITVVVAVPFENVSLEIPDVIGESPEVAQSDLAETGFRNITMVTVNDSDVDEPTVSQIVPGVGSSGMSEEQIVLIVSEPSENNDDNGE